MKNSRWLDVTEYLLWASSGVGSLASIASQQVVFAAAPLPFLLLLNLVNRRRLDQQVQNNAVATVEQLDQRLSNGLKTLDQQVQTLPNFLDLASLRQTMLQRNDGAIAQLQHDLSRQVAPLQVHDLDQMHQELSELRSQYNQLTESVALVSNNLSRLATISRVDGAEATIAQLKTQIDQLQVKLDNLPKNQVQTVPRALQDQINHLNRRLNSLPQPFDATNLKQEVDGLIKVVGDMVSRRDMARLMTEVEKIRQQSQTLEQTIVPMKAVNNILRKQVETLSSHVNFRQDNIEPLLTRGRADQAVLNELRGTIATLEQRLNNLPQGVDSAQLQAEMQTLVNVHLGKLQQQFASVQHFTQNLDRQQKDLCNWVNRLPQILDSSALQSQMKYLTNRLEWTETNVSELQNQVSSVVDRTEQLRHPQTSEAQPEYELVFNVNASQAQNQIDTLSGNRAQLEDALKNATSRVVVVFPYPDLALLDPALISKFKVFLDRGGLLDIGWGHLGKLHECQPRYLHDRSFTGPVEKRFLQTVLSQLTQLKRHYSNQFRFKVLGTDENFLVCFSAGEATGSYGILGVQAVATASTPFPEVTVGLRTTNIEVVRGLIDRFDQPVLSTEDIVAYYNRAITRYELGDKQGAIADYSEVLRIDPDHDVAYNNRALVRYDLGNKEGAIADFNRALLSNPHNHVAYCNRGVIRLELGDKVGAIADYDEAIQLSPECAIAYLQRGLAWMRLSNNQAAIEDFSALVHLDAQDAIAYFHRGAARSKLGDKMNAIRDFKQAAELFSAQGDRASYQQAVVAIKKLRKHLVVSHETSQANGA